MHRIKLDIRSIPFGCYSKYKLCSTGELVEITTTGVKTVKPINFENKLTVYLKDDLNRTNLENLHMLYYKTFNNIKENIEEIYDIVVKDGNLYNITLDNLELKKKLEKEIGKTHKVFKDKYSLDTLQAVVRICDDYLNDGNLENIRTKWYLDREQYSFFIDLLPQLKKHKTDTKYVEYNKPHRLKRQVNLIKSIEENGIEFTSKQTNIPVKFLTEVDKGNKWTLANWLVVNYDKYQNIF